MKRFNINKTALLILLPLAVIFLIAYSYLAYDAFWQKIYFGRPIFNSPDETGNYFFSQLFAKERTFKFYDQVNGPAEGLVTPRSMRVISGYTVPASFIGLPLIYGAISKLTGLDYLPFFTPLFSIVGIIFFYLLVKELFNRQTALLASALAFIVPAFWYYSAKGLMPNALFITFFIATLYFFIKSLRQQQWFYYAGFGLAFGLALIVRTAEVVWLAPLLLLILLFNFKKVKWLYLLLAAVIGVVVFSSILYFNQQIYGHIFSWGYDLKLSAAENNLIGQGLSFLEQLFLPFGFKPQIALQHLYDYTFRLFPLWTVLFAAGWLAFLGRSLYAFFAKKDKGEFFYFLLFAVIGGYLTVFYGSWIFNDNPDPNAITLGTSYARYWLPVYLFSLPPLAYVLHKIIGHYKIAWPAVSAFLFTFLFIVSFNAVMLEPSEGLVKVKQNVNEYQQISQTVLAKTESNAVIIAGRLDKVFWPERRVIFKLNVPLDYVRIQQLVVSGYPVYIFMFTLPAEADLRFLSQRDWLPYGLRLENSVADFKRQSLYPVISSEIQK